MAKKDAIQKQLEMEISDLRIRLTETEETLRAIHAGEVDALVITRDKNPETIPFQGTDYLYRKMIESMNEGAVTLLTDGTISYSNPRFCEMIQKPANKLIGNLFNKLLPSEEQSAFNNMIDPSISIIDRGDFTLHVSKSNHIPVQLSARHSMLGETKIISLIITDLTERKYMETALLNSEEQYRSLAEAAHESIILYNIDGKILFVNEFTSTKFSREKGYFLGKHINDIYSPESAANLLKCINQANSSNHSQHLEIQVEILGNIHWFGIWLSPVKSDRQGRKNFLAVSRDITERILAKEIIETNATDLERLYNFSSELAKYSDLDSALNFIAHKAVEIINSTFSSIVLIEGNYLVVRGEHPIRQLNKKSIIGEKLPIEDFPDFQKIINNQKPSVFSAHSFDQFFENISIILLEPPKSLCIVPLSVGSNSNGESSTIGLLIIGEARDVEREPFNEKKKKMIQSISDQAAISINRLLLMNDTIRYLSNLETLRNIDQEIMGSLNLKNTQSLILKNVVEQLGVDAASILKLNPETEILEYALGRGFNSTYIEDSRVPLGKGVAGSALKNQKTVILNLLDSETAFTRKMVLIDAFFENYICVPIITKGKEKGVLEVFLKGSIPQDPQWMKFLETLSSQAAIVMDYYDLFEDLKRSNNELFTAYEATIEGWSRAMELRDSETEGHTLRVTELALTFARELGFKEKELLNIGRGALLHDIGKIGISDAILLKSGAFTLEERREMEKHPRMAYDMLSPINYLKESLDIPYCHHEKWDGTGYPQGLIGEQIPISARMFAIVDVYDALSSDRPYRKAWPKEKVLEYILENSGSHFDPTMVEIFLSMISSGKLVRKIQ